MDISLYSALNLSLRNSNSSDSEDGNEAEINVHPNPPKKHCSCSTPKPPSKSGFGIRIWNQDLESGSGIRIWNQDLELRDSQKKVGRNFSLARVWWEFTRGHYENYARRYTSKIIYLHFLKRYDIADLFLPPLLALDVIYHLGASDAQIKLTSSVHCSRSKTS